MNELEYLKHLPFITESCNLGESILIFIEQTENWTLHHILNLVTKSLEVSTSCHWKVFLAILLVIWSQWLWCCLIMVDIVSKNVFGDRNKPLVCTDWLQTVLPFLCACVRVKLLIFNWSGYTSKWFPSSCWWNIIPPFHEVKSHAQLGSVLLYHFL